ncbi:MAG TPA: hypothetical protein PKC28_14515 [Bdellovibrionales bacterium]|nr:hypothetical protein [Bdellovibrionales bacterium]
MKVLGALPFSDIDLYLKSIQGDIGCIADTSYLIALGDKDHRLHEDALFMHEKLAEFSVRIFVSVTVRSEFIDFHRRMTLTETLLGMLPSSSKWRISEAVRRELNSQKKWINSQLDSGNDPYLTDSRIKDCKQIFLPKSQSGQIGWVELCKEYLSGELLAAWDKIVDTAQLHYIDMRADDSKDLFRKELRWESMYQLAEESGMGSNDAMILNILNSSVFPFVITMDFDLAYGVMLSAKDKTALVPDNLYRNRIKKLRF